MSIKAPFQVLLLICTVNFHQIHAANDFLSKDFNSHPYDQQVAVYQEILADSNTPEHRAGAAEALAFLRAYDAEYDLISGLRDKAAVVRREAAIALAWCGSKRAIEPLLVLMNNEEDWLIKQAAWTSLTNITGMEFPFDGQAKRDIQKNQIETWINWWRNTADTLPPKDVIVLANNSSDKEKQLRGIRALGALGGSGTSDKIIEVIQPYLEQFYDDLSNDEKHLVQSGLRSLARLGDPQSLPVLLDFLDTVDWARYAADALGEYGERKAVLPLIESYPLYARPLNDRMKLPQRIPRDDAYAGNNTQDRMPQTAYAIAFALARLPLDQPGDLQALRKIVPHFMANLPSDWDSAILYDIESDQRITAHLLERAGMRKMACDVAFESALRSEEWIQQKDHVFEVEGVTERDLLEKLSLNLMGDVPYVGPWFPALCRPSDEQRLIRLLKHESGWIKINATKALMFLGSRRAIKPIAELLQDTLPEAEYGFSGALEHAEYNDPAPRYREALIRALGRLNAIKYIGLLTDILNDPRNVLEVQYAAVTALDEIGNKEALKTIQNAELDHPFQSVRLFARESLARQGLEPLPRLEHSSPGLSISAIPASPQAFVFIKGDNKVRSDFNGQAGVDPWRQTYTVSNSGPAMRVGRNLYRMNPSISKTMAVPLTRFSDGFVADCEVSWDGKKIIFARRLNGDDRNYQEVPYSPAKQKESGEPRIGGPDDPWWHIWEINANGTGLRQLTFGPYHDVAPAYLPDGRIVFSTSRLGVRDEYHGFLAPGLAVMDADGTDIHQIGFNLGADRDPAIMQDGRIVFSRLDIFYSRLKTEVNLQAVMPDGTRNEALYGPERRPFWKDVHQKYAAWTLRDGYKNDPDNRNRVLRIAQPQPFRTNQILCTTSGGLVICGPNPTQERLVPHDRKMAVTSPYPLDENTILCAASPKVFMVDGRRIECGTPEFEHLEKGPELFKSAVEIDLALYMMDAETGEMTLLYNDPNSADFEARPIVSRTPPPSLAEHPLVRQEPYTAKLFCDSARTSRIKRVQSRGKWLRVIEGQPVLARHQTQKNKPTNRWKNHGATHARVLGTIPLAADGSFFVEVPADRLLHMQVLDGDRQVVGNQTFWIYARPGEVRSCVGCHENRNETQLPTHFASSAANTQAIPLLPNGDEFSYFAKTWMKGNLPDEMEERTRTVHSVNLLARQ